MSNDTKLINQYYGAYVFVECVLRAGCAMFVLFVFVFLFSTCSICF